MTLKRIIILLFLLVYKLFDGYGQSLIKGRVVDGLGFVIQGVNVELKDEQRAKPLVPVVSGVDGHYQVSKLLSGKYQLSFVKEGYESVNIALADSLQQLPTVVMEKQVVTLDELQVVGRNNPIKLSSGKLSFDLSKSSFGTLGSALDVLQKMPGVIILPNGKISLNGEEGVQLLIDGKTNFMAGESVIAYLSSIPAASLAIVELINQPSAELDAAGSARFINLKRNSQPSKGISAVLGSNYEQGKQHRMHHNVAVEANLNKVQLSNVYSFSKGTDLLDLTSSRYLNMMPTSGQKPLQLDMDAERRKPYANHYYKGQLDYIATKSLRLGTYLLVNNTNRSKDERVNSLFYHDQAVPDSVLKTDNLLKHRFKNLSAGGYATFQFADDSSWETYVDRQLFKQDDQQQLNSYSFRDDRMNPVQSALRGGTHGDVNINTLQSKYRFRMRPNWETTLGGKYTRIHIETNSIYQDFVNDQWQDNPDLANSFAHKEYLKALFMQSQYRLSDRLNIDLGLRYENAEFESVASSTIGDNATIERSYHNLFPNMTIGYAFAEQQNLSLHYNRRVNRPNFRDLNPFVEFNDPYLYEKGNPTLRSEFINNLELTWTFKNAYSLNMFYSMSEDPITKSYNLVGENIAVVMPLNLADAYRLGLRFNAANITLARYWQVQANANLVYKSFAWLSDVTQKTNKRLTPSLQLQNQIKLPFKVNFEVNGFVSGSSVEGQARISSIWSINTGLRRTMFQDKFTLYIYANDICKTNRPRIHLIGDFMNGQYQETYDSRAVGISLSYRLSKGTKANLKNHSDGSRLEENNRIGY